jgi:opacity protein-like surface antigen
MKKVQAILTTLLLLAAVAFAADVTGTWNATVDLGGGQGGTPTFTLKQDGDKVTGTYSGALGEAPIHGTIKGNDVTFDFDVQGAAVHYAGKLDPDGKTIKGTCDYGGQASGTFTATREAAKEKK